MGKSAEIPLYIVPIQDDGFHVFMEATVNARKVLMLLDTGASRTVFDLSTLQSIHAGIELEENEDKATGLGTDSVDNFMATLEHIEIGGFAVKNYVTGVIDLNHVNQSYKNIDLQPIAGVLGSDLLVHFDAVINYKKKTLKIRRQG